MKNLKVGDVVNDNQGLEKRVLAVTGELVALGFKSGTFSWYRLVDLKDYTLVQPEQTLEEKFREVKDGDSYYMTQKTAEHLAQIAEEHYKDKI
jgi:hypothetical protein